MMRRWFRALWLVGVTCLVAGLVASHGRRADLAAHDAFLRELRALQALDAELNDQVMQSRQALVTHYDHLVRITGAMRLALGRLERVPAFVGDRERHDVAGLVATARDRFEAKERAIEEFKTANAVLRTSARYFPTAARALRERLDAAGEEDAARLVTDLLTSVLHQNQLSARGEDGLARRALRGVHDAARAQPAWAAELAVAARHAEVVVDGRRDVDARTRVILETPTRAALDEVDATYSLAHQEALRASQRTQGALFLGALALLALVSADVITRLRGVARSEREAAEKLIAANLALLRDKEREKELSELKSRFVSMTSHEFRTPLSVILSSTELVEAYGERWSPSKRADHFRRIKAAVRGMTDLLDGILVIGRADVGRLEFAPSAVDLPRFCAEMAETVEPWLGPGHAFEARVSGDFEDAWLDEKLLNHILTNLLSNAIKYSPDGGMIAFEVEAEPDAIVFRVRDAGIGITPEDRPRLFESFHRGRNVGVIPGTGLGLAVVKRAVDAHRGSLAVESGQVGTVFEVRLPRIRRADGSPAPQRTATASRPDDGGPGVAAGV